MSEQKKRTFDDYSDIYHDRLTECLKSYGGRDAYYYTRLKTRWLLRLTKKHLGLPKDYNFLDLGCGTATAEANLCSSFRSGVGIDLSYRMLKARECKAENCFFLQGNVAELPFSDGTFDLVFSITLMHHLADDVLPVFFDEIYRVLKPGGLTVHFDHNPRNFLTRKVVDNCEYDRGAILRPLERITEFMKPRFSSLVDYGYIIFIPAFLKALEPMELIFKKIPYGGQYFVVGRK